MKKYTRQRLILDLIEENIIKTQERIIWISAKIRCKSYTSYNIKRY